MKFSDAIDAYVADMWADGGFRSERSERSYRSVLYRHLEDVANRDPSYIGVADVKRTLGRWRHPNTRRTGRAVLMSFYRWTVQSGMRRDNPVERTKTVRKQPTDTYRLTRDEAVAMLLSAQTPREKRAIFLGICAGLRNSELRGLRGADFLREGYVHVPAAVAKGKKPRWVPVLAELHPVVDEIRANVGPDEYVLPAQRFRDPGINRNPGDKRRHPSSSQALRSLVMEVAKRAGIRVHVHPHLMRHAFGDHVARGSDLRTAQFLMGHSSLATTETYLARPRLEDLAAAVKGFTYGISERTNVLGVAGSPKTALKATTGIEPV